MIQVILEDRAVRLRDLRQSVVLPYSGGIADREQGWDEVMPIYYIPLGEQRYAFLLGCLEVKPLGAGEGPGLLQHAIAHGDRRGR